MNVLFQGLNHLLTAGLLRSARCLAIAQPMGIGEAVACLPMAGLTKKRYPHLKICYIGTSYAKPVIDCCKHIDQFLDADEVMANPGILIEHGVDVFLNPFPHRKLALAASLAKVPIRVGNLRRPKTARFCNRFVIYSRKDHTSHEIELNLQNLAGIGLPCSYTAGEIFSSFGLTRIPQMVDDVTLLPDLERFTVIFHPKSNKNGREWPARYYAELAGLLPEQQFRIVVTGAPHDRDNIVAEIPDIFRRSNVVDLCGKLQLADLFSVIAAADGIVASGTGPIHFAAALGKHALGIYPPRDTIDPAHWRPFGPKGEFLCLSRPCKPGKETCEKNHPGGPCACMEAILPDQALTRLMNWVH